MGESAISTRGWAILVEESATSVDEYINKLANLLGTYGGIDT